MSDESNVAFGPLERMSLNEAFIILGITDNPDAVSDEAIIYSYDHLVPHILTFANSQASAQQDRQEEFKRAIEVIADHRDSIPLKTHLIDLNTTPESHPLAATRLMVEQEAGPGSASHPVGLENVAQTCYMNSLFQYYFTVKPLRNAILTFEQHEEGDLSDEDLRKKQISRWELQRSKRCTPPKTSESNLQSSPNSVFYSRN